MIVSAIISPSHGMIQPGTSQPNVSKIARETCHVDINVNIDVSSAKRGTWIAIKKWEHLSNVGMFAHTSVIWFPKEKFWSAKKLARKLWLVATYASEPAKLIALFFIQVIWRKDMFHLANNRSRKLYHAVIRWKWIVDFLLRNFIKRRDAPSKSRRSFNVDM